MTGAKGTADRDAYRSSGVDVAAGERAVDLMRAHVESTRRPELVGGLGGFGGAIAIPAGYREPLLVASTDGVGTKTAIARSLDRFDTIGIDLVAMCTDDVVCCGAEPLAFLDYIAVGQVVPEWVAELVGSVAAGCRDAGCALIGGETAEHPGLMDDDAFDLSGCCIGVVERADVIDGTRGRGRRRHPRPGIVRAPLERLFAGPRPRRAMGSRPHRAVPGPPPALARRCRGRRGDRGRPERGAWRRSATCSSTPTTVYARAILAARAAVRAAGSDLHGLAHITGGGLPGNVPRALPDGLAARLDPERWRMPSVMRLFGALGRARRRGAPGDVQRRSRDDRGPAAGRLSAAAIEAIGRFGIAATVVGEVVEAGAVDGSRYVEAHLEGVA